MVISLLGVYIVNLLWEAADAEIKVPSGENSLNVLPIKPGVGQYMAIHATLTARDFYPVYFYLPVHSSAFFQSLSRFFRSCVGPQNKLGHTAGCRFLC